jgi:Cof subfamily protein (haloacid dehalogenase superfamily)
MYRLIACDLDGTLLDSRGVIRPVTRATLDEALAQGLHLVIATGRSYPMMAYFCHDLPLTAPQITCNGAVIVDPRSSLPVRVTTVPPQLVVPVLRFLDEQAVPASYFGLETIFIRHDNPYAELLVPRELDPPRRVDSLYDLVSLPCAKLVAMDPPEAIARLRPLAEAQFGADLYVTQTSRRLLEFHHPQVSKGEGLAEVVHALGVLPHEVVAFGDSHNDLSMLAFAGLGVAMGNAEAEVKAVAGLVAPSNDEDGIAWALRTHILARP